MAPIRVGIVGASGETGTSIVNGLMEAGGFDLVALTRPASMTKPVNLTLKDRGLELRALDLKADQDDIVAALEDIEILISAVGPTEQLEQIPLVTAAKTAGVKRFIPCAFLSIIPVGGIHNLRDTKEIVYNHMKQLYLPYTIIDVGWWYQIAFPRLPSGKIDYAVAVPNANIPGDGNQPSALTDLRDIGRYVAKIIVDDRTLNKQVLVYNEMWTPNQTHTLLESISNEKLPRDYVDQISLQALVDDAKAKVAAGANDFSTVVQMSGAEYMISWGIRGDNTPERAEYLGYMSSKELYPDMGFVGFEEYLREVVEGKAKGVYDEVKAQIQGALKRE